MIFKVKRLNFCPLWPSRMETFNTLSTANSPVAPAMCFVSLNLLTKKWGTWAIPQKNWHFSDDFHYHTLFPGYQHHYISISCCSNIYLTGSLVKDSYPESAEKNGCGRAREPAKETSSFVLTPILWKCTLSVNCDIELELRQKKTYQ